VTDLSAAKQQLLQRLLDSRSAEAPVRLAKAPVAGPTSTPSRTLSHADTNGLDSKAVCSRFYDTVTEQLNASAFGPFSFFLNYGYVPTLSPQYSRVRLPEMMLNKNSVQLVLEVLEDCVTPGDRVLDVGCGRGGMVFVITQFFQAARITGLDLSAAAVAFCHGAHRHSGVAFLQGDAEQLPFQDASFDIVTNLESSSCYPDLPAFYSEVRRVLVAGGRFLYSDCLPIDRFQESIPLLKRIGFTMERDRDITANVLASCDQIAKSRVGAYGAGNDAAVLNDFLGSPGSHYYEEMRARRWVYRIYKLRKE
jgi:ubiquinone/menaquinone biosynthesis C-methylase UbiE